MYVQFVHKFQPGAIVCMILLGDLNRYSRAVVIDFIYHGFWKGEFFKVCAFIIKRYTTFII